MAARHEFFVSCTPGLEALLADELNELGLSARAEHAGASFAGTLDQGYRAVLWSRIASRVLLLIARFPAPDGDALYQGTAAIDWSAHFPAHGSFKIAGVLANSRLTHSLYVVQRAKDAIVDQFRARYDQRPSVDREHPDVRIHIYVFRDQARVSIDLSGAGLHRRGYRGLTTAAPLKENLAAAMLRFGEWPKLFADGAHFIDPLCGSGVLLIEAGLMAFDVAPGLLRPDHGFNRWLGHDALAWAKLLREAESRRQQGIERPRVLEASDADPRAVEAALANAVTAGIADHVHVELRGLAETARLARPGAGLLATNPPWGERIGAEEGIGALYAELGRLLRGPLASWQAVVLTTAQWPHRMRMRPDVVVDMMNGPLELKLMRFAPRAEAPVVQAIPADEQAPASPSVQESRSGDAAIEDRLRKNLKRLARWRKNEDVHCYRLYDADIPEYAAAIDVYASTDMWMLVQEYAAPASVPTEKAARRLRACVTAAAKVMEVPASRVVVKERRRQGMDGQYEKLDGRGDLMEVQEGGLRFLVNLTDYLDSGLYLDHRRTRAWLRDHSMGRRTLNLYGYTGSASVYMAAGGARETVTIDRSNTYLEWAERNLALNGYAGDRHLLVRADCLNWLQSEARRAEPRYSLIFADPPTFSNSKSLERDFDVQKDHVALIDAAMRLLEADGELLFSVHFRRFKLDAALSSRYRVQDMNTALLPPDFARDARIHYCWRITHGGASSAAAGQ